MTCLFLITFLFDITSLSLPLSLSLSQLLNHIRLPLLPLNFLKYRVESNPYIKRSLDCRDLIDEAKNYHLFPDDYSQIKGTQFHPRKSTVGVLFAIGGRGAIGEPFCSVECYNFRTNQWYEGPELRYVYMYMYTF